MQNEILSNYFSKTWKANYEKYKYTGFALLDEVRANETVLDVGCGFNLFKPQLGDRLVGIDPYNDAADIKVSIEDFNSEIKFDVVFCLGSINFGTEANIISQIRKIKLNLKKNGRIYWRQNPGLADHGNEECRSINFFPWSLEKNYDIAYKTGFIVATAAWDSGDRIYSVWCNC